MSKKIRTKINKSERIEIRCTKAFKETLKQLSVQNNMSIGGLIESICTDKINENLIKKNEDRVLDKKNQPDSSQQENKHSPTHSKRKIYEQEIWRMLQENATPTETADWLNSNGLKPQRGSKFTMNSVHSIRRRLKREQIESRNN